MKTPFPYQVTAIELGLKRPLLLADQCGLGKSLVGIEIGKQRLNDLGGYSLVICPKSLIYQWVDQIKEQDPERNVVVIGTGLPVIPQELTWYVMHYEAVVSLEEHLPKYVWTTIIVDEAHRIKNRNAKQTKVIKKLSARRRVALTGTPIEKTAADLWSILNWLYPGFFSSYWKFFDRYVETKVVFTRNGVYKSPIGTKNAQGLADDLHYFMLQRTKEQVAPQLPPRIETLVRVPMEPVQESLYNAIDESEDIEVSFNESEMIIPNVLAKIIKLRMASSMPSLIVQKPSIKSSKELWLKDYLTDNPYETIVVFTTFRGTAIALQQEYADEACRLIGGDGTGSIQPFLEGKKRLLIGTIASMSEGLNLQIADTAIFFDEEWSSVQMSQAIDRIHRINITSPKNIIYLISSPVDELIHGVVDEKLDERELVRRYLDERGRA